MQAGLNKAAGLRRLFNKLTTPIGPYVGRPSVSPVVYQNIDVSVLLKIGNNIELTTIHQFRNLIELSLYEQSK